MNFALNKRYFPHDKNNDNNIQFRLNTFYHDLSFLLPINTISLVQYSWVIHISFIQSMQIVGWDIRNLTISKHLPVTCTDIIYK